jgi:hypothetical protein
MIGLAAGDRAADVSAETLVRQWARMTTGAGLAATAVYVSFFFLPETTPLWLGAAVVSLFGPLLSAGSLGLYHVMAHHRRTVSLQLAAAANVVAGALVTSMLLVQTAVGTERQVITRHDAAVWPAFRHVDFGLDVAWDVYIGIGTILFAMNAFGHPLYGRVIGAAGVLLGAALLGLNFASFPDPPGSSGLIDAGPFVGLWYAALAVMTWRAPGWLDRAERSRL